MVLKSFVLEGVEVRVQLRRNARRITMHVKPPDGRISVIAPYGTAKAKIVETVRQFWPKLKVYREDILAKYEQERPSRGREGDGERIWDRDYSLRFRPLTTNLRDEVSGAEALSHSLRDGELSDMPLMYVLRKNRGKHPRPLKAVLCCEGSDLVYYYEGERPGAEEAIKVIDGFLDATLLKAARAEIERYGAIMGCSHKVKTVVVRHFKSRWGHCKPLIGEIMVNGRLVRLPYHCLSYIVVHELCHFTHLGHGADFYGLQERYYPQWRESRQALQLYPLKT